MQSKADTFIAVHNPYRSKYTIQTDTLFGPDWRTKHGYLTKNLIASAIVGSLAVGYYSTTVPDVLGVDIDDHKGKAWSGTEASPMLLSLYGQVAQKLRCKPSVLVQSPRGLHSYWKFTERLPGEVLYELARERLSGIPVEIKPTPDTALRIPAERRLLDPGSMMPLSLPIEVVYPSIQRYHPSTLFDTTYVPDIIRESLQEKKQKLRVFKNIPRIEAVENEEMPFKNGQSNDSFLKLCLIYRVSGLDLEQAFYRFQLCLFRSPHYAGDLRNHRRLRQRIEWEYKNNPYQPKPEEHKQRGLFNQTIIDNLIETHPFAKQRTRPIERFLDRVLLWCDWHDAILANEKQTSYFDYLYPYYRKNRREGLYPLPVSFLSKANDRYNQLMPWLSEIGFLEKSWYQYSADAHICNYYRVHRDRFM